jgi:excisionase family DNA binding protein
MPQASQPRAMTVREVAGYLNVNEKTVYRLAQRRTLPGFKVAGAWRFQRSEIDGWIEAQKKPGAPSPERQPPGPGRRLRSAE